MKKNTIFLLMLKVFLLKKKLEDNGNNTHGLKGLLISQNTVSTKYLVGLLVTQQSSNSLWRVTRHLKRPIHFMALLPNWKRNDDEISSLSVKYLKSSLHPKFE